MSRARIWIGLCVAALAVICSSSLSAQLLIERLQAGSSGNSIPMCYQTVSRNMLGIPGDFFAGNKGSIVSVGIQFYTGSLPVDTTWPNFKLYMGESDTAPNSFSTTYDANYDSAGKTLVYDGSVNIQQSVITQAGYFNLQTPYKYGGTKTLVMEFIMNGAYTPATTKYHAVGTGFNGQGCRIYNTTGNTTDASGSIVTNVGYGMGFLLLQNSVWTGAVSSDWNVAGNWDAGVPSADYGAEIPDALTTPNSPTLPNSGDCLDLVLKPGAILNGGNGRLNLLGSWINEGGTFNHGTSLITYGATDPQTIETGGRNIGNIRIANVTEAVRIIDDFPATSTGTIEIDSGAALTLSGIVNDFTGTSQITNNGTINIANAGVFGIISKAGLNFGKLLGTAATINDVLVFQGRTAFGDGTSFSGLGMVQFQDASSSPPNGVMNFNVASLSTTNGATSVIELTGGDMVFRCASGGTAGFAVNAKSLLVDIPAGSDLTFTSNCSYAGKADFSNKGIVGIQGDLTANTIEFNNEGRILITGDVIANSISFNGVGEVEIQGTLRSLNGNIILGGDGWLTSGGIIDVVNGAFIYTGNLDLTVGGFTGNVVQLEGNGVVTINGNVNVDEFYLLNNAAVSIGGTLTADIAQFNCPADVAVTGATRVVNQFTLLSTGNTTLQSTLTLNGDFSSTTAGNLTISSDLNINGNGTKLIIANDGTVIQAARMRVIGTSLAALSGDYVLTSTNPANPALQVVQSAGLELIGAVDIRLGQGGAGRARIQGVLATNEDSSSGTTLRPIIGAASGSQHAIVAFTGTSGLAVNGLVFDRVGPASQPYAVSIEENATVNAFNKVSFIDSLANLGTLQLSTTTVPKIFNDLEFTSSDNNVNNIDASTIALGEPILVTKGENDGGNLFGTSREVDPNDAIIWEDPSLVDILTDARLPNALVGSPYTVQIQVGGGNRPYQFVITQKPDWLEIDPVAGVISGVPTLENIGTYLFPITLIDASKPNQSVSKVFTIQVETLAGVDLTILNFGLSKAKEGEVYSQNIVAGGGVPPYTFVRTGTQPLPMGLSLSPGGAIFGVPLSGTRGVYTVRIRAQDSSSPTQTIETEMKLTVQSDLSDPEFLSIASADPGSGCAMNPESRGIWFWIVAGVSALALATRRRRVEA